METSTLIQNNARLNRLFSTLESIPIIRGGEEKLEETLLDTPPGGAAQPNGSAFRKTTLNLDETNGSSQSVETFKLSKKPVSYLIIQTSSKSLRQRQYDDLDFGFEDGCIRILSRASDKTKTKVHGKNLEKLFFLLCERLVTHLFPIPKGLPKDGEPLITMIETGLE